MKSLKLKKIIYKIVSLFIFSSTHRKKIRCKFGIQKETSNKKHLCPVTYYQNLAFKRYNLSNADNLIVFLTPQHEVMSGGIYSFFSLTKNTRKFYHIHQAQTLLMTTPNNKNITYFRQFNFRNEEDVLRFNQLFEIKNIKRLILHVPEYHIEKFYYKLTRKQIKFFKNIKDFHINILNQNELLMNKNKHKVKELFQLTPNITMTCSHHSFTSQQYCDKYKVPISLLPAYTDLSNYTPLEFDQKDDIIIYSYDKQNKKNAILNKLIKKLPQFKLIEIKDISFESYMQLATKAKFSITFGEGFDGYFAQPILQGGVSFAVYNNVFFPSTSYKNLPNIFSDYDEMLLNIDKIIKDLCLKPKLYKEISEDNALRIKELYSEEIYLERIKAFYDNKFDFHPSN